MNSPDDLLKQIWPSIRARHFYPELPVPQIAQGKERVGLEMKGKTITLSAAFINEMSRHLDIPLILEGLLDHAVSHYIFCPWDFSTHLTLYKEARSVVSDKDTARKIADMFMDAAADTYCISRIKTPLAQLYRHLPKNDLDEVICALYQKIWGTDLGVEKFGDIATRLSHIPYLDRSRWPDSIRRFALVIREIFDQETLDKPIDNPNRMGEHKLGQYPPQQIEQGIKDLAAQAQTPAQFNEIMEEIQNQISEPMGKKGGHMGLGKGSSMDADSLYYMKLAQKYTLFVRKRKMEKSRALYPHHHVPWEIGKPVFDIDPWKSFSKLMPGLTKSWHRIEGVIFGREYGTPDCLIIIDASKSMINPKEKISHAVLGAACAVDAYLWNGARVAVYNFGDAGAGEELILPFTDNKNKIYKALCHYFGGGTRISTKQIQALQTVHLPDIFLITDMQITNLEKIVHYFSGCKNRITAVNIGKNKYTDSFRLNMAMQQHIQIYGIDNIQDIPGIVLGRVRELYEKSG